MARLTDEIRSFVVEEFIQPARRAGKYQVSIRVKDVRAGLSARHDMRGKSVMICQALQSKKLHHEQRLEVEGQEGPPSGKSPTVVMHFRLLPEQAEAVGGDQLGAPEETPDEWANRLAGKLRGLLKEDMAGYGGGKAFLRWIRSEAEDPS